MVKRFRSAATSKRELAVAVAEKRDTEYSTQIKKSRAELERLYKKEYGRSFHPRKTKRQKGRKR
jgi:hypothetical protein